MESLEKQIGERLRLRREELNFSQGLVAKKMKVATTTVQRLENGETQPRIDTLIGYCCVVGLTVEQAVGKQPIENPVRIPSNLDVLEIVKNALKIADNSLIQRVLQCSQEEQQILSDRLDMIEHKREIDSHESAKIPKKAK